MGYSNYSSYYGSYPSSSTTVAAASAALGFLVIYSIIVIAIAIVQIIAMWKLFTKAGEKGWKSIIPIYNAVILFKISGLSPWLILVYLASIIPFIGWIAVVTMTAILAYKLAMSFGKDGGWAVGIFFLAPIFYMLLGFGKSEYVGPGGQKSTVPSEVVPENAENNE